ncbi:MAG: O-methyltransferase [Actinomycetota bacterium]|nr:O-methyltransferase [Actinomycetota bacterium]
MTQELWSAVDRHLADRLAPSDPALDAALRASADAGLPPHHVSPAQGKLLQLLVQITGARAVLEIGTLGGYSTIWMGRGLPPHGRILTLEADARHAEVAAENLERAGLGEVVDVRLGPALETLPQLTGRGPFDFVFIDADKPSTPEYLEWAVRLARRGTVIVADNVVRRGEILAEANADPGVRGMRRLVDLLAGDERVAATAVQTVGSKGYDGFALALVVADPPALAEDE